MVVRTMLLFISEYIPILIQIIFSHDGNQWFILMRAAMHSVECPFFHGKFDTQMGRF